MALQNFLSLEALNKLYLELPNKQIGTNHFKYDGDNVIVDLCTLCLNAFMAEASSLKNKLSQYGIKA